MYACALWIFCGGGLVDCLVDSTGSNPKAPGSTCYSGSSCSVTGACSCNSFTQNNKYQDCRECATFRFGHLCSKQCPGLYQSVACFGFGNCDWGHDKSGQCSCNSITLDSDTIFYAGADCVNPVIASVTPRSAEDTNNVAVVIKGVFFFGSPANFDINKRPTIKVGGSIVTILSVVCTQQPCSPGRGTAITVQFSTAITGFGVGLPIQVAVLSNFCILLQAPAI